MSPVCPCALYCLSTVHGLCLILAVEADTVNAAVVKATDINYEDIGLAFTATDYAEALAESCYRPCCAHRPDSDHGQCTSQ